MAATTQAHAPLVLPRCYAAVWCFALAVRLVCCAFLCATAGVHLLLAQPRMAYSASMLGPTAVRELKLVGFTFGGLAIAHAVDLVRMLWCSTWHGELLYKSQWRHPQQQSERRGARRWLLNLRLWRSASRVDPVASEQVHCCLRKQEQSDQEQEARALVAMTAKTRALAALRRSWSRLFGRHGLFGVESEHFELQFALREISEVVAQSVQAYSSSLLVASPWINSLYVGMVVLNCWSTPIVTHLCRRANTKLRKRRQSLAVSRVSSNGAVNELQDAAGKKALLYERLWCLTVELCLDAGAAMLVPAIIIFPYARVFDLERAEFPVAHLYDDVWFVKMLMAAQQFFAVTSLDFVFTLAPHVGLYFGLGSLISLSDTRHAARSKRSVPAICSACDRLRRSSGSVKIQGARNASGPTAETLSRQLSTRAVTAARLGNPQIGSLVKTLLHFVFAFWGAVVLFLHLGSFVSFTIHHDGCKQRVWPWVTQQLPCCVFEYNCYRHNTSTVPASAFKDLEPRVLSTLLFTHCSELVVPSTIAAFSNLVGIGIYNSTIVDWPSAAAITQTRHASMKYVYMARTNMSTFPVGLQERLPEGFVDMKIAVSNLTTLPDDLADKWGHALAALYLERCDFRAYPTALKHLHVADLSLFGNPIESMASVEFGQHAASLKTLVLADMPLQHLPDRMPVNAWQLELVSVENTQLREFPSWVYDMTASTSQSTARMFASGTPFCASQSTHALATAYGSNAAITCVDCSEVFNGKYPLALVAQAHSL